MNKYKKIIYSRNDNRGVAALLTVVIIAAAVLIMAYTASILGLGELDMGYTSSQGTKSYVSADGCMEEALYRIRKNNSYTGGTLSLDNGSCIISVSGSDPDYSVAVTSTINNYTHNILSTITISNGVIIINSWQE